MAGVAGVGVGAQPGGWSIVMGVAGDAVFKPVGVEESAATGGLVAGVAGVGGLAVWAGALVLAAVGGLAVGEAAAAAGRAAAVLLSSSGGVACSLGVALLGRRCCRLLAPAAG